MVLSLTISQNLYSILSRPEVQWRLSKGAKLKYTTGYVSNAFAIVYSFGLIIPICFNFILRIFGCTVRYSRVAYT